MDDTLTLALDHWEEPLGLLLPHAAASERRACRPVDVLLAKDVEKDAEDA